MFKVWLEWDYGQEDFVFTSEEAAKRWVNEAQISTGNYDEDGAEIFDTYDALEEDGMVSIQLVRVIS